MLIFIIFFIVENIIILIQLNIHYFFELSLNLIGFPIETGISEEPPSPERYPCCTIDSGFCDYRGFDENNDIPEEDLTEEQLIERSNSVKRRLVFIGLVITFLFIF